MGELLACPFCRELFSESEASICPECDLALVPLKRLPLSHDALLDELEDGELVDPPEDQSLGALYRGRERGLLSLLTVAGFVLFFLPWVHLERPNLVELSGYDLAAHFAPWLFGGAIAQFLLIALLYTRRTISSLRGMRVIATLFSVLTAGETLLLLVKPPLENSYFNSGLDFRWALYASFLLSVWRKLARNSLGRLPDRPTRPISP